MQTTLPDGIYTRLEVHAQPTHLTASLQGMFPLHDTRWLHIEVKDGEAWPVVSSDVGCPGQVILGGVPAFSVEPKHPLKEKPAPKVDLAPLADVDGVEDTADEDDVPEELFAPKVYLPKDWRGLNATKMKILAGKNGLDTKGLRKWEVIKALAALEA